MNDDLKITPDTEIAVGRTGAGEMVLLYSRVPYMALTPGRAVEIADALVSEAQAIIDAQLAREMARKPVGVA